MKLPPTLLVTSAILAAAPVASAATLIHNGGFTANNLALPDSPAYGSNAAADSDYWSTSTGAWGVTGTPDIALLWDGGSGGQSGNGFDTYANWDGRGAVIQLDAATGGTPEFSISFIPTVTVGVHLASFDLDAWAGGGEMVVNWSVLGEDDIALASGQWTRTNAGGRDTILAGVTGGIGQTLTLHLDFAEGDPTYLALDNLAFDQVPEPGSLALLGLALGAFARRRR